MTRYEVSSVAIELVDLMSDLNRNVELLRIAQEQLDNPTEITNERVYLLIESFMFFFDSYYDQLKDFSERVVSSIHDRIVD